MADYKRKFRGIVENSWTHLVALVLLQLGYVYDFFYNIGFFLYRGVVGLVQKAREIPQLRQTFNSVMETFYHVGLSTFGLAYSLLRNSFYYSLHFTKGFLIKLLSGDFAGLSAFVKSKASEAGNSVSCLINDGSAFVKKSLVRLITATFLHKMLTKVIDEETLRQFLEGPTMTRVYKLVILIFTVISAVYLDYLTVNRFLMIGGVAFCISCIMLLLRHKRRRSKSANSAKVSSLDKRN